jgi:hypothetical protein
LEVINCGAKPTGLPVGVVIKDIEGIIRNIDLSIRMHEAMPLRAFFYGIW